MSARLAEALARVGDLEPVQACGRATALVGLAVSARLEGARAGDLVTLDSGPGRSIPGEIVGFRGDEVVVLPLGDVRGLGPGSAVRPRGRPLSLPAGPGLIGRVLDALGQPLDGRPLPAGLADWPADRPAPPPLRRGRIGQALPTGLRAIDGPLALAEGQRLGLFAGPGAGKSTLLGQLARQARADAVVVALVGERGREVREFVEGVLGPEGLERSLVVVATSDAPARLRAQAAWTATAHAEWLAEVEGRSVLLLVDSLTRFARAQREAGLAAGEPPVRQGHPPSVFAALPRLLERAGPRERGCITAVYTVLLQGGDLEEPVAEEARSLLDGHLVLEPRLAARGWFPAVDVLRSLSRLMPVVTAPAQQQAAARLRELLDAGERVRDLVALGAYARGSDPLADRALAREAEIEAFLRQGPGELSEPAETRARLEALVASA
jgi:type III secretion protein N (ATPase)